MEACILAHPSIREQETLARIPLLAPFTQSALMSRLKGLTNRVYKIETDRGAFCLRIPGEGTAEIIDRANEEANNRAAAAAGVAPEVLHFGADGVMVTRFIEGVVISPAHLCASDGALDRAAGALRRLHTQASDFARVFHPFEIGARYAELLAQRGALPPDHLQTIDRALTIRDVFAARPAPLKPCHCDPTGANMIDTGEHVFLIDWEYSGMNDPMWDLAYLSLEAGFDDALDRRLLQAYLGRAPTAAKAARMRLHKPLCDMLSGLWALIQHSSGKTTVNFRAYADETFARCRSGLEDASFAASLDALRKG